MAVEQLALLGSLENQIGLVCKQASNLIWQVYVVVIGKGLVLPYRSGTSAVTWWLMKLHQCNFNDMNLPADQLTTTTHSHRHLSGKK